MAKRATYFIGDSCICWSIDSSISEKVSKQVLAAYNRLKKSEDIIGIRDLVPAYTSLAIHFDPLITDLKKLTSYVDNIFDEVLSNKIKIKSAQAHSLPVIYNGADLQRIENIHSLSKEKIIKLHIKKEYMVAMIGFQPHFPYLIGLSNKLETPRLDTPRNRVPAGSVAIGGAQAGIYPQASPGGWNLIGTTNPELLLEIKPADKVQFFEVEAL